MITLAIITIYIIIASSSDHDVGRLPRCHPRRCSEERVGDPMLLGEEGDEACPISAAIVEVSDEGVFEITIAPPVVVVVLEVDATDDQVDFGGHCGQADATHRARVARRLVGFPLSHSLDAERDRHLLLGITLAGNKRFGIGGIRGARRDLDTDLLLCHDLSLGKGWMIEAAFKSNYCFGRRLLPYYKERSFIK